MHTHKRGLLWLFTLCNTALIIYLFFSHMTGSALPEQMAGESGPSAIPQLVGTWTGSNQTVSDLKGYKFWGEKTVYITEQKDRRFRGHFTYPDGTRNFFGVIYPDNKSFTWVASNSRGYNHGRILGSDQISACYVESWEQATAGCAEMARTGEPAKASPEPNKVDY